MEFNLTDSNGGLAVILRFIAEKPVCNRLSINLSLNTHVASKIAIGCSRSREPRWFSLESFVKAKKKRVSGICCGRADKILRDSLDPLQIAFRGIGFRRRVYFQNLFTAWFTAFPKESSYTFC